MKDDPGSDVADPDRPDPDMPDPGVGAQFVVGPPEPVTDSRELPAVDAVGEDPFVTGADLGDQHPDNVELDEGVDVDDQLDVHDAQEPPADDVVPSDDELAALLDGVDPDDVDDVGFDESDAPDATLDGSFAAGGS